MTGDVLIDYTNHRGERRNRWIVPSSLLWAPDGNEWHPGPQWLLWAMDREDGDQLKAFAMKSIHSWTSVEG